MAKFNKNTNLKRYVLFVASLASFVAVPAMAAVLVQNFMTYDLVVDEPPIRKDQGLDANYDLDNDDTTGYLQVRLGETISNNDSGNGAGGSDTLLSNEEITFTCFSGDRVYYTDVIQLVNTDTDTEGGTGADWDVNLVVEPQLDSGLPSGEISSTGLQNQLDESQGSTQGTKNADIWLYPSEVNTLDNPTNQRPNPNAGELSDWYDAVEVETPDAQPVQIEVVGPEIGGGDSVTNILVAESGKFRIPSGEQRQLALVADCSPEMQSGDTVTFNVTVEATPASQASDF